MNRKSIILSETQVKRLLENRINEVSATEIAEQLKSINCTGEDMKLLVKNKLIDFGFEDIRIKFLGKTENKGLMYIVYTEGPVFVFKAKSESDGDTPCMNVYDVTSYSQQP